ncbi:hypothetical protein OIV83_000697 [Microbotryomycetes sp. JL201]|nr:hypothetical protein OIV83_000697 [Microbotryomycetes sp. JL201]
MVPQPVWHDRPGHPLMQADPHQTTDAPLPSEPLPFVSNVSGKFWKQPQRKATARLQSGRKDPQQGESAFARRLSQRKKDEAVKKLEREMKAEKEAEVEAKRTARKERQQREAEKKRLEEMAQKMSAKKLQRMKKRLGRSKKVAH